MTGFPLARLLLLGLCLAGLAIPLAGLTGLRPVRPQAMAVAENGEEGLVGALVSLRFAHLPSNVRVSIDGETLWEGNDVGEQRIEIDVGLALSEPAQGVEIWLEAEWEEGVPETVIEVELEPDGLATRRATAWGEGRVDEVLSFRWREGIDE
jgi:hypothetical protein